MKAIRGLFGAALVLACFGVAVAKLPPPTDAQKAAAAEAKAKAAAGAEKAHAELVQAQDRTVARYYSEMKAKGKTVAPPQMPSAAPTAKK